MRLVAVLCAASGVAACDVILGIDHDYRQGDAALDVVGGGEAGDGGPSDAGTCSFAVNPVVEQLALLDGSFGIASDDSSIYVTDMAGNRVLKCPLVDGGCKTQITWTAPSFAPTLLMFEGPTYVGWTDQNPDAASHRLRKVERDWDGSTSIDTQSNPYSEVSSMLYSFLNGTAPSGSDGVIFWTDPNIKNVAQYYVTGAPPQGNYSLFVNGENDARALAGDDSDVYWLVTGVNSSNQSDIHTCAAKYYPLDTYDGGCTPTTVIDHLTGQPLIAVRNNVLYWVEGNGVRSCNPKACVLNNLADVQSVPGAIAVDDCALYWTDLGDNSVKRCALPDCSGGPTRIASNQNNPRAIALDSTRVYWSTSTGDASTGGIWSVPK